MFNTFIEHKYNKVFKSYVENETPYRLIETLGKGSYGLAYLLIHKKTGKRYVLKRMRSKHRQNNHQRSKFQQEINMLKLLDIPHVPNVSFEAELQGFPFYIMDFIDGQTFEQAIFNEGKKFSVKESFEILKRLLEIVIVIHQQGIVHRDLRIPNILTHEDNLYIIDFGLAAYMKRDINFREIENPKKAENHCSDLYYIGHFLLFLLYSNYTPTKQKERSWQEELQLPADIEEYIERLLLIRPAFSSAEDALISIPQI